MGKILDLGCGYKKVTLEELGKWSKVKITFENPSEIIGVDLLNNADVKHNLEEFPYPFESSSIDYVYVSHTLEHIDQELTIKFFEEIHRILKVGGYIEIISPHCSNISAMGYLDHTRMLSLLTFKELTGMEKTPHKWGEPPKFELLDVKLNYLKKSKLISLLPNFLANLNVRLAERIWAQWIGGFEEIKVLMRKNTTKE